MALETGRDPDEFEDPPGRGHAAGQNASPATAATLGDALSHGRAASGRSLADLSAQTRVPVRYLTALEQNDFSILPNRVFSAGYVRSYAAALGLDEQDAVERFRRESPDPTIPLQAPSGIAFQEVRSLSPKLIAGALVLLVAVVGWNVFQRINLMKAPQPSDIAAVPKTWAEGASADRDLTLGAPRPAPPDQSIPPLYVTPGLEMELTGLDPAAAPAPGVAPPAPPVQRAFNPRGAIYGAPAGASQVVLQARKPASLVVRVGDGRVLFARQLAEGEAWRAPLNAAAVVDVSDPAAFDLYLNGEHGGALSAPVTPLATLNARAQVAARQIAADAAARAEAARRAAALAQPTGAATTPAG
jgi:hypothetical protein